MNRSRRVSGASATTTILSIWSAGCAEMANSSPRISKGTSSRFAPLPSTKDSARAAWSASRKPSGWCRKCKRPSSSSRVMSSQQVAQLDLTPPVSFAMHAKLIPSYYLDRVAETRTVSDGEPLRELAERLRAPLFEPGGVLSALSPEAQDHLHDEAKRLAPCSSARVPMWRGEMATCPCAAINCEDSICRASGSASPPFTTFSSPGLTGRRQRSAFSVRSRARCLRRFWNRWSWRPRL